MSDLPPPIVLTAPGGDWRVRILDLSGGAEGGVVEEIGGFGSVAHVNDFAARYVRDSIELCRTVGASEQQVLETWLAFGEDAEVLGAGDAGWRSAASIAVFAREPSDERARNWRAIDPRAMDGDDIDVADQDPSEHEA